MLYNCQYVCCDWGGKPRVRGNRPPAETPMGHPIFVVLHAVSSSSPPDFCQPMRRSALTEWVGGWAIALLQPTTPCLSQPPQFKFSRFVC